MLVWKNDDSINDYIKDVQITDDIEKADIFLIGANKFDLPKGNNLKAIFRLGVGDDNIPYDECKERNIDIHFPSEYTKQFIYEETANFTCHLILQMYYNQYYNEQSIHYWERNCRDYLNDKNLLIIGMGNIGKKVYDKMNKFLYDTEWFDILNSYDQLNNLIKKADIITLHIPAIKDNINFFDKNKMKLMKDDCILINTARGNLINEDDLYNYMKNSNIQVAFDTFWNEPYNGKLLDFHPNRFYATPHIASHNKEFLKNASIDFKEMIDSYRN